MSAPLTLAEVRNMNAYRSSLLTENLCRDIHNLCDTIEWFAEKALPDIICNDLAPGCGFDDEPGCQVCRWLRNESIKKGI